MKWDKMLEKLQMLGKDRFMLLLIAGIMMVVITMPLPKKGEEKSKKAEVNVQSMDNMDLTNENQLGAGRVQGKSVSEIEVYRERLCVQLKNFLQKLEGVGEAEVYITMHSSSEIIVERNSPYSTRSEEEYTDGNTRLVGETENDAEVVLIENEDGSQAPIVVKEIVPVVKGIVVAVQGGDRQDVKKNITEALQALFGIEAHKIKVVKLNT